jgi:hypothetical protein
MVGGVWLDLVPALFGDVYVLLEDVQLALYAIGTSQGCSHRR